eukprot:374220-Rhodomonas_salina.1
MMCGGRAENGGWRMAMRSHETSVWRWPKRNSMNRRLTARNEPQAPKISPRDAQRECAGCPEQVVVGVGCLSAEGGAGVSTSSSTVEWMPQYEASPHLCCSRIPSFCPSLGFLSPTLPPPASHSLLAHAFTRSLTTLPPTPVACSHAPRPARRWKTLGSAGHCTPTLTST